MKDDDGVLPRITEEDRGCRNGLEPCPFCGGEAIAWQPKDGWAAGCNGLNCAVDPETADSFATEAEAITAWNRRAGQDGRRQAIEDCAKVADELSAVSEQAGCGDRFDQGYAYACKQIAADIRALPSQDEWRPIETAPKDGTWLLAYGDGDAIQSCQYIIRWNGGGWEEVYSETHVFPTRWQHLPPAKAHEGEKDEE